MTERHKQRIKKLKELLELMKEKNTDGRLTDGCTRLAGIIMEEDVDDGESNPGGTPPPPPGGSGG